MPSGFRVLRAPTAVEHIACLSWPSAVFPCPTRFPTCHRRWATIVTIILSLFVVVQRDYAAMDSDEAFDSNEVVEEGSSCF